MPVRVKLWHNKTRALMSLKLRSGRDISSHNVSVTSYKPFLSVTFDIVSKYRHKGSPSRAPNTSDVFRKGQWNWPVEFACQAMPPGYIRQAGCTHISDGHDGYLLCLGHAHTEMAFVDASCSHCESMPVGTLRLSYFFKRSRVSSADSRPGPSTSGYEASAVSAVGNLRATMIELPLGQSHMLLIPQHAQSPRSSFWMSLVSCPWVSLRKWHRPHKSLDRQPNTRGPLTGRWHRPPIDRILRTPTRCQSVPETGDPGKERLWTCLQ
ncbi:hypothetical protein DPX16_18732 [Anabarilius grahami]|uniref:Uncharacterized protein n=1 Tax=Anabarilius grahami TaxID=495550 RepID=A0A3N0Z2J2_ANAGA|nr:hypothetical protein DPX16_18732 [Anabarilius grahami]